MFINYFSILFAEKCIDKDKNCEFWEGFCTTDPYVQANCLLTCDSTCPSEGGTLYCCS